MGRFDGIATFGGGVQQSLRDLVADMLAQDKQRADIDNMQGQRAMQARGQNIMLRRQDDAERRYQTTRQDRADATAKQDATAQQTKDTARNQGFLRAAIQGSQNVAGSGDPTGAAATRGALRVALQAGGAKPNEIPQEPVPEKVTKPSSAQEYEYAKTQGYTGSYQDYQTEDANRRRSTVSVNAGTPRPLTQTAEAGLIDKLSRAWGGVTKNATEMQRQLQIMRTGVQRFDADPNGASQAVLVTFQKILDPESVVRESEYARSPQGLAALQRIQGWWERFKDGGAGVPKAQLVEMVRTAEQFIANTKGGTEGARKRIEGVAKRYNIPSELVFNDAPGAAPGATGGGAPKGGGDPLGIRQ